jgi:pyridoxal 5'-phosphate synthase pdxT subunit
VAGSAGSNPVVGVLALQGAFREHRRMLSDRLGIATREVRTPADLAEVDALVIPGGESTTLDRLLGTSGLRPHLAERLDGGMPAFGTCAGLILLGSRAEDGRPDQQPFGAIDLVSRRNGYGRQLASFEGEVALADDAEPMHGVFIRAPRIVSTGEDVEVVATHDGEPVAARQGKVLVAAFHPELTGDDRLHRRFLALLEE